MATAYTTLLGLALPVTGELNGTWGDVVNDSITELVEDAIAGSATASVTSADWTLTTTGSGAANQARSAILIPTGTPGVSRNIIAPSSSKAYIVDNQSNAAVVVKGSATTGVSIATNTAALVAWDGADFVLVSLDLANATGTLPVTKGGTGATTLTGYVKGSGTSALTAAATIPNTDISGLGTMSTQNAGSVAITGGTVNGTTIGGSSAAAGTFTTATATTGNITTVNATTVDTTNLEVTNLKAKDGTASATIADSTGIITVSTQLNVDNININGNTISSTDTNGNIILDPNGTGFVQEDVGGVDYNIVSQVDIGTAPNEIPLNQYLGALAYQDTETPALDIGTGITTGTGTICKVNGGLSGGIYRMTVLIDLTGLNSGGTAGDIIGVNGTALPCYIARLPAMTVLGGRMTCLELPAGGDTDIDLYSAAEGTGVEDQAISALTETQIINGGTQALGTVTFFSADPSINQYLYLVGQSTSNATYTAGRFLIEIFGVQ